MSFLDTIHETIGGMTEWERGWYHACINTLWWNSSEGQDTTVTKRLPLDYDQGKWLITRYSPSGSQQGAESFYSPTPPPAEDLVEILFDEDKFRAVWAELDFEGSINYYRLVYRQGQYVGEVEIVIGSTESYAGLPEDWEAWPEAKPPVTIDYHAED